MATGRVVGVQVRALMWRRVRCGRGTLGVPPPVHWKDVCYDIKTKGTPQVVGSHGLAGQTWCFQVLFSYSF